MHRCEPITVPCLFSLTTSIKPWKNRSTSLIAGLITGCRRNECSWTCTSKKSVSLAWGFFSKIKSRNSTSVSGNTSELWCSKDRYIKLTMSFCRWLDMQLETYMQFLTIKIATPVLWLCHGVLVHGLLVFAFRVNPSVERKKKKK